MLLFDGGGGGGGPPPPLSRFRRRRQEDEFGGVTTETIALTQAFDNSLWSAAEATTTTTNSNFNEINPFNPTLIQSNGISNNNNNLSALAIQNQQQEQSFSDWWHEYWSRQPFPSGYTQSSITLLACFISTIIFLIVVGNLLVCIAIFTEKSLKPTQNWFIASLAVSDMLLGLVIMPFSLARDLMGFWIFGPLWCDIHEALDVLLSTASINTLCLISLDRYWSITQAVSYLKKRTPRRGALMIAFVWVLSAAVSLPPLFGWKKQLPSLQVNQTQQQQQQQQQQLASSNQQPAPRNSVGVIADDGDQWDHATQPTTRKRRRRHRHDDDRLERETSSQYIPSVISSKSNNNNNEQQQQQQQVAYLLEQQQLQIQLQQQQQQLAAEYPTCQLSDDVGYVLYSAIGSFYIPCAVMVFTYIKIFLAARSRARRAINKQARNQQAGGGGGAASAKGKGAGLASQNHRGSGGRSATIAGLTKGRANKQQLLMSHAGDSTQLLTGTNSTKLTSTANGGDGPQGPSIVQDPHDAGQHHHNRHYRNHPHKDSTTGGHNDVTGMMRGKLVVLERRKSTASQLAGSNTCNKPQANREISPAPQQAEQTTDQVNQCLATLTTSGAKQAAPYMNVSVSCDAVSSSSSQPAQQQRQRKPTNESNDSSLITVMSASMTDLPQVTRFNFVKQQQATTIEAEQQEKQKAAQLLRAISRAGHELSEENLVKEIEASAAVVSGDSGQVSEARDAGEQQVDQPPPPPSHSTNETCFMTIEEDSDNFDAQTGRTIMMIASTARQSSGSILASKSAQARADMMMTMQPEAGTGDQSATCMDAACLRRRQRRSNRHVGSSYCGSSMTLDDEEDEDDEDEEEEEDEEDEDGIGDDDDDECLEDDDLLTDDCNGYSGSCNLDQYCHTSACAHCRECAAAALTDDDELAIHHTNQQDSPSTCNCKSSIQDSPAITNAVGARGTSNRKAACARCQCHTRHHNNQKQRHQERACSEGEGQSLTGDDNLSLTDYYRSNEDNSSVIGHDVLDATPAERHHRNGGHPHDNKRRSVVASAIASMGGGLKGMTGGNDRTQDEASVRVVGRKKSSMGFHLARFAGSGAASRAGGGLLALAAAQSQQLDLDPAQQQQAAAPRNLKTLRQNFFHKLNQLTAKSAAKQNQQRSANTADGGKSSAQSSYGSSYEPSVDYATTSNMPSTNDHYHQETTFGETDCAGGDWPTQQAGDRRQSGARSSKLLTIAQQTAARHQIIPNQSSDRIQSKRPSQQLQHQDLAGATQPGNANETDSGLISASGRQSRESIADGKCNNVKGLNSLDLKHDNNNNNNGDRLALISESEVQADGRNSGSAKRRSDGKNALALVNSNQSNQRSTATSGNSRQTGSSNNNSAGGTSRAYLASDNERHKRKLAKARERRATLILGLIMAAFICSWLPFFTFYVIRALCHVCREYISPRLEAFIFWLGYCNSAINPIIYTIFNRDFRRAFRKILFKCL